jgi:hypothetical protein
MPSAGSGKKDGSSSMYSVFSSETEPSTPTPAPRFSSNTSILHSAIPLHFTNTAANFYHGEPTFHHPPLPPSPFPLPSGPLSSPPHFRTSNVTRTPQEQAPNPNKGVWKALYVPEDYKYPWSEGFRPPGRTLGQKIEDLWAIARSWKVTFGDAVCVPMTGQIWTGAGANRVREDKNFTPSASLRNMVAWFLHGKTASRVADVLDVFRYDPAGLPAKEHPERTLGFCW